ncbi:16S rRNA (cytidine(1402)-2'-O)-methyltransferase [Clostridium luticellarii]|jgi:16S rRNA (cytidine1402-2'-O)-methyltransferase|uniref:Ribosomal RNA small subunit methyltransferase I n=1 Tax=Clostridium luticellarii TaxID=1691940 RepID=A0A2T0B858_9CLOT|nr:16S rRNA (cytidine(1402)-2'-O)-methyltransferase [Clostridium luticellarii]MCI1944895.1 16S rRNA (cytidine(1402)-2'-O)-methyltransferase [Clostridium luticellarii]MCI1968429.1 16S rRNA (cytidine(1402)-2'-O)-methyltransferase [Clostridium luticellarii]MCI1995427.1 16S rRNA (cytidine(1402)-2'-O)-methyltransferase [Clostridium luticellarii]MCI2039490.1 16S rRNA (cytidine(1402)-2'-O)-methyltransferase [Clostridium luticellarii]PRR80064.1 Ribosomal RNA small subunit methyltransferase I [Clostrid
MGKLFLVATPIGNLQDITLRGLEVLKSVDLIAAEDTRHSLKLLNHFNIKKPLVSYHKYNENEKSIELIKKLRDGDNIALISDAGTPGISDPGAVMVRNCIKYGVDFEVIPGATAVTTALVYSGIDNSRFIFLGFLPRDAKSRRAALEDIAERRETLIFYEAPHRLLNTLKLLRDVLGNRHMAICRELTKIHEEILRSTLEEMVSYYENDDSNIRGEFVIVVEGKSEEEFLEEKKRKWINLSIEEHIKMYMDVGLSKKESVKKVAKDRNVSKSEIYSHSINLQ